MRVRMHKDSQGISCAIDNKLKHYGYWCNQGLHVWSEQEDAEKCCSGDYKRCLYVGQIEHRTVYGHYWLARKWNDGR